MRLPVLLAAVTLAACDSSSDVSLGIDGPSQGIGPQSTLAIKVYGYDSRLADASATLIHERTEPLRALPVTIELGLPPEPHTLIDQGHGPVAAEDAGFYVMAFGDLDGNGRLCPGELFPTDAFFDDAFFGPEIPSSLEVALEPLRNDVPCRDL